MTARTRRLLAALAAAGTVLTAGGHAGAQISADQVRKRYDRQTKGTSVEDFAREMDSDDPMERLKGVKSMADSNEPAAVPYLVQALGDADMRVKAKAIDSCGNMRAADATPVLILSLIHI